MGAGIEVHAAGDGEILSPAALGLVELLHRELNAERLALLERRRERPALAFVSSPEPNGWKVAPAPPDLRDRRCEITGPPDRKLMINALNSGARGFMCDFEDACSPTWTNVVEGQANLRDAVRGSIAVETPDKSYALNDEVATLLVRPRGWHLDERHVTVDGEPRVGIVLRLRARVPPQRGRASRAAERAVLLPARSWRATRRPVSGRALSSSPRRQSESLTGRFAAPC